MEYGTEIPAKIISQVADLALGSKQDTGNASVASIDTKTGEVTADPTANTVLARLKDIKDAVDALEVSIPDGLALETTQLLGNASVASIDTKTGEVVADPTANTILARLKDIKDAINALEISIPNDLALEATQVLGNASLTSIDGKVSTEAKQDIGNASLASLDTKTGEVQATPTTNTILGRLKDLWDKLTSGIRIMGGGTSNLLEVNTNGEAKIIQEGTVDTNNQATDDDVLGPGATWTGDATNVLHQGSIVITASSNVESAPLGLVIELSDNGIDGWGFEDAYTVKAGAEKKWSIQPAKEWYRIKYTNGDTVQTSFSITPLLKKTGIVVSSHRLSDTVKPDDDAQLFKGVLAYEDINDEEYNNVGIQNPMPVDGDSVYAKDIWEVESDIGNFSGMVRHLFNDLHSTITDITANNPKEILIHFNRTIVTGLIGFGTISGNFSNVKLIGVVSGNVETVLIDESSDNTDYTSRAFPLPETAGLNALKVQFHTADTVTLSNCVIVKSRATIARITGSDPDGIAVNFNATRAGNFKISVEEYEPGASPWRSDMEGGGKVAVGTTAVLMDFVGSVKEILITADKDNTGVIYVGKSNVTSTGANAIIFLEPNETLRLSYDDVDVPVYVVASIAAQNVWKGALI
jgi:hypothetical protein